MILSNNNYKRTKKLNGKNERNDKTRPSNHITF